MIPESRLKNKIEQFYVTFLFNKFGQVSDVGSAEAFWRICSGIVLLFHIKAKFGS